jgi:hypothetical protein
MAKTLAHWPRKGSAVADPANFRRWDSISTRARSLAGDVAPRMIAELSRDITSGLIVSVIGIAYCVSFSALIFSGELAGGIPVGLNAIFLGAGISGIVVALASSLPRAVGGPDTPVIAVFSALAMVRRGQLVYPWVWRERHHASTCCDKFCNLRDWYCDAMPRTIAPRRGRPLHTVFSCRRVPGGIRLLVDCGGVSRRNAVGSEP